jgi:hypothetical protein
LHCIIRYIQNLKFNSSKFLCITSRIPLSQESARLPNQ